MEFNLNCLLIVGLVLLIIWCLIYGCRFSLHEGLDNPVKVKPVAVDDKSKKCVSFADEESCQKDEDCSWTNDKCDAK